MKRKYWLFICLVFIASQGFGQSLGEVAKKEKKRRKDNKGAARVIDNTELNREAQKRDREAWADKIRESSESSTSTTPQPTERRSGGNNNSSSVVRPRDFMQEDPALRTNPESKGSDSERDQARRSGAEKLKSIFSSMLGPARSLVSKVQAYQNCQKQQGQKPDCQTHLAGVDQLAVAVGRNLDEAQTVARKSHILPGELREIRERLGLDHRIWDAAVRFAAKYR